MKHIIILSCLFLSLKDLRAQKLEYSFVVTGCSSLNAADTTGVASTANTYQLGRMFAEVSQMHPLPKYLFFIGDLVLGCRRDTLEFAKQLRGWISIYAQSPLASKPVQLIAISGANEGEGVHQSSGLMGATERTFVREMKHFLAGNNGPLPPFKGQGPDSIQTDQSQLTYSFDKGCDHFVVLNTDGAGRSGRVPLHWIRADLKQARHNAARHIFVFGYKPAYSSGFVMPGHALDGFPRQRDSLWNCLESNQCDAYFSSHHALWDTVRPHSNRTLQIITGNGGSEPDLNWRAAPFVYFGYTKVDIYTNNVVKLVNYGRNVTGTYYAAAAADPTTVHGNTDIAINPLISHTPLLSDPSLGPFLVKATISSKWGAPVAQLNYAVNGVPKQPISATVSHSAYLFSIPAQQVSGYIDYKIQVHDSSQILFYEPSCNTDQHHFIFGGTGIENIQLVNDILLYPNPAQDKAILSFELEHPASLALRIYDLLGKEVIPALEAKVSSGLQRIPIQVSTLPSGIYIVSLSAGKNIIRMKLVVNH